MVYIQLSQPYRNFDKAKIKTVFIYDALISVNYSIINDTNELFDKNFNVLESDYTKMVSSLLKNNFSIMDNIHILLLEYMIEKNIETGTLEVK